MPSYRCRACNQASKSAWECSQCRTKAGQVKFAVIEEAPITVPTNPGLKTPSTSGGVPSTTSWTKGTPRDLFNDKRTQQDFGKVVANNHRSKGRVDNAPREDGTRNGSGGLGGQTTKTTDGPPPSRMPPSRGGVNKLEGSGGQTTTTRGVEPPREETKQTGPSAQELVAEAKDLLAYLKKLCGEEERQKAEQLIKTAIVGKTLPPAVEDLRAKVAKVREQLIREASGLLKNLKGSLDQQAINDFVGRIKAAQEPKGESAQTLTQVVEELRSLNPQTPRGPQPSQELENQRQKEEERKRQEELQRQEEELKRQEEEQRRKEEAEQRRKEAVSLVQQAAPLLKGLGSVLTKEELAHYLKQLKQAAIDGDVTTAGEMLRQLQRREEERKREEERQRQEEEERQRQEEEERRRQEEEERKQKELIQQANQVLSGLIKSRAVNITRAKKYIQDLKSAGSSQAIEEILQELKQKEDEARRAEEERQQQEEKRKLEEERQRQEEQRRPRQESPQQTPVGEKIKTLKISPKEKEFLQNLVRGRPQVGRSVTEALAALDDPASVREAALKLETARSEFTIAEKALNEKAGPFNQAEKELEAAEEEFVKAAKGAKWANENLAPGGTITVGKEKEYEKYWEVYNKAREVRDKARIEREKLRPDKEEAERTKRQAEKVRDEAQLAFEGAENTARTTKTRLLNTVRFGPLSRPTPDYDRIQGLSREEVTKRKELARRREEAASAIIADMQDHPDLALEALELLQETEHPEAFAGGVAKLGALNASNFGGAAKTPSEAAVMRRNALKMASLVGGADYFDRMTAYYRNTDNLKPDPNRASGEGATQKTALNYTGAIGRALIDLDPGSRGVNTLRDGLQFHPDSLKDPLPTLAVRVEKFLGDLRDPTTLQKCRQALDGVQAPKNRKTQTLVQNTLGVTGPVNVNDAKAAVLSSLLTPLTQGPVGSCFATCNCMDFQDQKPSEMMQDLAGMVNTGNLTKPGVDPVPVVVNLPPNENALLRSWEYTVATVGARSESSDMKGNLSYHLSDGLKKLKIKYPSLKLLQTPNLSRTMSESFHFTYDPTMARKTVSSDGSSTKGGWVLMKRAQGDEEVKTESEFKACLKEALVRATNGDPKDIERVVEDGEFMGHILGAYAKQGTPWRQGAGGNETYSKKVLFGGDPKTEPFYTPREGDSPQIQSANVKDLLAGLVETLKDSPGDTVTLSVPGHAQRALPKHPSLDILKSGGPISVKVEEAFRQAKETADQPLDTERAAYLYDKALRSVFGEYEDLKAGLAKTPPPQGRMTPAQLRQAIFAQARIRLGTKYTYSDEGSWEKVLGGKIDGLLSQDLYPVFVLADTNWGDPKERYQHVVAPDPKTGEPKLWQRGVFDGSMKPETGDWTEGNWQSTK